MSQRMSFADGSGMLRGAARVPDIARERPDAYKKNGLNGPETGWPVKVPNIIRVRLTFRCNSSLLRSEFRCNSSLLGPNFVAIRPFFGPNFVAIRPFFGPNFVVTRSRLALGFRDASCNGTGYPLR